MSNLLYCVRLHMRALSKTVCHFYRPDHFLEPLDLRRRSERDLRPRVRLGHLDIEERALAVGRPAAAFSIKKAIGIASYNKRSLGRSCASGADTKMPLP